MTYRVLLVCMGNICRSPTAEGVLRCLIKNNNLGDKVEVDSAGTHGYHVGRPLIPGRSEPLPYEATTCHNSGRVKWPARIWITLI